MHIQDFHQRLSDLGAKPMHIGRITRAWLRGMPLDTGTRNQKTENFLPLAVRNALPEISSALDQLARLSSEHRKRSINHIRQDNVCFQEAGAGEQFHGSSAS
jgi:23S rRNA (adenine2503-C2)-methyltransferase